MHFSELGLHEALLSAVAREGYSTPTPIQQQAIPAVLAGGMSGVFSVALTNPVDVIKTRVQATPLAAAGAAAAEGGTNGAAAGHTLAVVRGMLAHEGVGVFTTGMVARAWKIGLGQAVIFGTYDAVRRRL